MRLVSANVLKTLDDDEAARALGIVLAQKPQMGALQEWGRGRDHILREVGTLTRLPRTRRLQRPVPREGWSFVAPITGGPPLFIDATWGEWISVRSLLLAEKRLADRATRGVEGIAREHATGRVHAVLNLHLLAHHDDPAHKRGWAEGKRSAEEWAESWEGYPRWVLGDGNKHLMDLPPLVSCWHQHDADPTGPHGGTIDAVWGNRKADDVRAFRIGSDHRAVVVDY